MKKNFLIKGILVLVIIASLTIGFARCGIIFSTTGTVHITIANDIYWYDIYIDGVWKGQTDGTGNLTLYNVPTGNRYFEAHDTSSWNFYGYKWKYIYTGTNNYVSIYVD